MNFQTGITRDPSQRSAARYTRVFRPVVFRVGKFEGLCLVRNISAGGLMGEVPGEFQPGSAVDIEMNGTLRLNGRIVWCRDGQMGVCFDQEIDVPQVLQHFSRRIADGKVQRAPRLTAECEGDLYLGNELFRVPVVDVSQGGAKIVADFLAIGQEVVLVVDGLDSRRANVCWKRAGRVGLVFFRQIRFAELAVWAMERFRRLKDNHSGSDHQPSP